MAIMRFHPFFTEIRKKIGDGCFRTRKKGIEYGKNRIPANPRTAAQIAVRKQYGAASQAWAALSNEEKEDYNRRAAPLQISGWNLFVKEYFMVAWYEITIDNSTNSNDLTDYQILVNISNNAQFFADAANNPATIQALDEDKTTVLSHYTELFDTANNNAKIWIKVPLIPASSTKTIYIKLDQNKTTDTSDPAAVFDFWDDFDTFDTTKWGVTASASVSVADSIATISATAGREGIYSLDTFAPPVILECRIAFTDPTDIHIAFGLMHGQNNFDDFPDGDDWEFGSDDYGSWYMALVVYDSGDVYTSRTTDPAANTFYNAQLKVYGIDRLVGTLIDTETITTTGEILTYNPNIRFTPNTANNIQVDWVRIRKLTDPEPTVTYSKL